MQAKWAFEAMGIHQTPDGRRKLVSVEYIEKGQSLLTEPADYLAFAQLQQYRDAKSKKSELCAPILALTRPGLARNHLAEKETLRQFVKGIAVKYPKLMRCAT